MELKEFIKTAITDITEAVSELQEELKNGTIVNPSLTQGEHGKSLVVDNEVRMMERLNFDIAVTATEAMELNGNAKAGISVFGAKVGAENKERTESGRAEYKPDFAAEFAFCCINDTCTGNGFDLYPIVSLMAAKGETDSKGIVKCEGEESRKGHFTCDTTLSYSVHLEYQKDSRQ